MPDAGHCIRSGVPHSIRIRRPGRVGRSRFLSTAAVLLLQFLALSTAGVYSFVWRYVGLTEIRAFGIAALTSLSVLLALRLTLAQEFSALRVPFQLPAHDFFRHGRRRASSGEPPDALRAFRAGGAAGAVATDRLKSVLLVGAARRGSRSARNSAQGRHRVSRARFRR